jgi:hypothetical protein
MTKRNRTPRNLISILMLECKLSAAVPSLTKHRGLSLGQAGSMLSKIAAAIISIAFVPLSATASDLAVPKNAAEVECRQEFTALNRLSSSDVASHRSKTVHSEVEWVSQWVLLSLNQGTVEP